MQNKWLILLVLLSGCSVTPNELGFTDSEWSALSRDEQVKIKDDYNKIQWTMPEHEVKNIPDDLRYNLVNITIKNGTAKFGKNQHRLRFKEQKFSLHNNACYNVSLTALAKPTHTKVKVCYNNYRISVDPSPWNLDYRQGSAFIYANSFWKFGFVYNKINTSGLAGLRAVTFVVKAG